MRGDARGSARWSAPCALGFVAASTTPAFAHTTERAFILLLPTGYYLLGGALAVAGSFMILLALPAERLKRWSDARWTLGRLRVPNETGASLASFAILVVLLTAGYVGSRDPLDNPLPLTVWTIWWIGLTIAHALFGNLWRYLNPWAGPFRLLGLRKAPLPYHLGYWPAIIGLLAFAWFELVHLAPNDPAVLAQAIILYTIATWIGMALFGEEAWLSRAETFSVFFSLIARIAPLQSEPAATALRQFKLLIPGRALVDLAPLPPSGVLFVLLTLAAVSFDGLSKTFWWLGLNGINPLEFPGRSAVMSVNSIGLVALWGVLGAAFLACIWIGRALAGSRDPFWPRAGALAASILPISVGYQFAHYLTAFLVNGQYAAIALTDPFALGWFNSEERMHRITTSFLSHRAGVTLIWNLQAAGIVIGHIIAVLVAHLVTLRAGADRMTTLLSQAPLAVLMVAYTLFGLWLLSTPAAG
ncbi:hypothetical protein [Dongia deserti]|uniref:hypothetical protein n=1 Tax=Dongia deserti TaxID=2268030 RepID=UPI000E65DE0A|nr:hypothetical protein [Dongia deserti]